MEMISDKCIGCTKKDRKLDQNHALSCKRYGGLIFRHDHVKEVFRDIGTAGRLSMEVEPPQAFHGDKQRPDILVRFGKDGHDLAYDLTIVNPVRDPKSIEATIQDEQEFLARYDKVKTDKYHQLCVANGISFCPIVMSAFGGIHRVGYQNGLKFLLHKIQKSRFTPPNWAAPNKTTYWLQRIVIALWSGNARKVAPFLRQEPQRLHP